MAKDMVKTRTGGSQASAAELYDFMKKVRYHVSTAAWARHHSIFREAHITRLKGGQLYAVSPESCKGSPLHAIVTSACAWFCDSPSTTMSTSGCSVARFSLTWSNLGTILMP